MGLLNKKKSHKQPIQALQSKNPTGLPFYQEESIDEGSTTSLIAAKAAALTFSKPNNNDTTSQRPTKQTATKKSNRNSLSFDSISDASFGKIESTAQSRTSSVQYAPLQVNIPRSHPKRLSNNDNDTDLNMERLTLNIKPQKPLHPPNRSPTQTPSRSPALHPLRSPLAGPVGTTGQGPNRNPLSVQAASAAAKSISSQNLTQPHMPIQSEREYSSSSNSAMSSIESLPLYAKLQYTEGNTHDSKDYLEKPKLYSDILERSNESLEKSRFYDSASGYSKDSLELPKSYNHNDGRSKDSILPPEFNITLSENDYEEKLSQKSGSEINLLSAKKNNSGSYTGELAPTVIEEGARKDEFPDHNRSSLLPPLFTTKESGSSIKPVNSKLRKPPPSSPPMSASLESSFVQTPTQSLAPSLVRRPSSPKRKPPPDYFLDADSWVDQGSVKDEFQDEVESLPQYPLGFDELKRKGHHRPHGIRRVTKKMFKNKLKSSNIESDKDSKPFQFKTTMRKEKKKDKFNEEKPWKNHSERNSISEQERKRYEGVWVSNKGLYMDLVDPASLNQEDPSETMNPALSASRHSTNNEQISKSHNLILNLVVRELWSRSKLPKDTLAQIWDLVDLRKDGTLDKRGFIVGMWLVDQCLYGRKLPKVLDDSVWNSVSSIGLNVVIKPKKVRNR